MAGGLEGRQTTSKKPPYFPSQQEATRPQEDGFFPGSSTRHPISGFLCGWDPTFQARLFLSPDSRLTRCWLVPLRIGHHSRHNVRIFLKMSLSHSCSLVLTTMCQDSRLLNIMSGYVSRKKCSNLMEKKISHMKTFILELTQGALITVVTTVNTVMMMMMIREKNCSKGRHQRNPCYV